MTALTGSAADARRDASAPRPPPRPPARAAGASSSHRGGRRTTQDEHAQLDRHAQRRRARAGRPRKSSARSICAALKYASTLTSAGSITPSRGRSSSTAASATTTAASECAEGSFSRCTSPSSRTSTVTGTPSRRCSTTPRDAGAERGLVPGRPRRLRRRAGRLRRARARARGDLPGRQPRPRGDRRAADGRLLAAAPRSARSGRRRSSAAKNLAYLAALEPGGRRGRLRPLPRQPARPDLGVRPVRAARRPLLRRGRRSASASSATRHVALAFMRDDRRRRARARRAARARRRPPTCARARGC